MSAVIEQVIFLFSGAPFKYLFCPPVVPRGLCEVTSSILVDIFARQYHLRLVYCLRSTFLTDKPALTFPFYFLQFYLYFCNFFFCVPKLKVAIFRVCSFLLDCLLPQYSWHQTNNCGDKNNMNIQTKVATEG